MDSVILGCIGIGVTIFLGLVAIAIAVFFGMQGFRKSIGGELTTIREKVIIIQETAQNVWDVLKRNPILVPGGTVQRELKNLGKVNITAEPHQDYTDYFITMSKHLFDGGRIEKLSQKTDLEPKEKELFKKPVFYNTPVPSQLIVTIPSTDPEICTKYISYLLKWLDSIYFDSIPQIDDFEKPIQI